MKTVRVKQVAEIINGFAFDSNLFNTDRKGLPVTRIRDIVSGYSETFYLGDYDNYYVIDNGALLVGMDGEFNIEFWNGGKALLNQRVCRIVAKTNTVDEMYLRYVLGILLKKIEDETPFVTVKHLSSEKLKEEEIPLPSLPEQQRIADLLSRAARLRRLRRVGDDLSDSLLQSVFLEMFGDPERNPKKWKKAKLGDVITSVQDGPHVSPEYSEIGIPFLSTRNIRPGQLIWDDVKYISEVDAQKFWKRSGSKPEKGDILYTKGGTTGYAKVVNFDQQIAVWVHIAVLKLRRNLVNPFWLESMLNSEYCYKQSQELTFGIANHDFGIHRMPRVEIYLPPLPEQEEFAAVVRRVESLRARAGESARQGEELFQSLLALSFVEGLSQSFGGSI